MADATSSPVFRTNDDDVQDKIKRVFSKVDSSNLKGLLQFWAPIKTKSGRLTTCDQPFTLKRVSN